MICWRGTTLNRETLIGATTSHTLNFWGDVVEVAGSEQGRAREFVADISRWAVDIDRLLLKNDNGLTIGDEVEDLKEGTEVNVTVKIGWDYFEGKALVASATVNGPLKGKTTASVKLSGTGELTAVSADAGAMGVARFDLLLGNEFEGEFDEE